LSGSWINPLARSAALSGAVAGEQDDPAVGPHHDTDQQGRQQQQSEWTAPRSRRAGDRVGHRIAHHHTQRGDPQPELEAVQQHAQVVAVGDEAHVILEREGGAGHTANHLSLEAQDEQLRQGKQEQPQDQRGREQQQR
jgi:hypothetical protein